LDPITRAQLRAGDWNAYQSGRFRKEWFQPFLRRADANGRGEYVLQGNPTPIAEAACWKFCTVDPACTEKETSDFTAIATFAVTPNRDLLILDVIRKRLAIDRIAPEIAEACRRWRPQWMGIEATGFQVAILEAARRQPGVPSVMPLEPEGKGKLVRATPAIIRSEAGQVYLPESAPWKEDFVAECVQFTGDEKQDAHDDQVDCLAYAVQQLDRFGTFETARAVDGPPPSPMHEHICGSSHGPGLARRHILGR
jgi:predicted phage terminase large subunit-like protein